MNPAQARHEVESFLRGFAWVGDVDEVVLALHEALVNASRHGGGARRALARLDSSGLELEVWDGGDGFSLEPHVRRAPDPMAERGRGLWLIGRVASSCEVRRQADAVALVIRFDQP
ncbi:MAG: ATP-binding protein [Acidimicrobiales bacterium]